MTQREFRVVERWGTPPDHLYYVDVPSVAVDSRDNVYVLGRGPYPVIVYGPDGEFLRAWGNGVFTLPHGIYIDADDNVYCTDRMDHTVRVFDTHGRPLHMLGVPNQVADTGYSYETRGAVTRSAGPFNGPTNVAVSASGRVYVSDGYGNARVHAFDLSGNHLFSWGEPGSAPGQFHLPHGIAVDAAGQVYVADRENSRVQIFSADGVFVNQWTHFDRPADLYIGHDSTVYVAELGLIIAAADPPHAADAADRGGQVSVCDLQGTVLHRFGREGAAAGALRSPHGITADSTGNVYVGEVNWGTGVMLGLIPGNTPVVQKFSPR